MFSFGRLQSERTHSQSRHAAASYTPGVEPSRDDVLAGRIPHPLHDAGRAEADCCYLFHLGRKSGRRYETEIWFGAFRDTVYIVAGGGPGADWYRNALAAGQLDIRIGATTWSGVGTRAVDSPAERELAGWLLAHRYPSWQGDADIGLTRDMWCFTCPVLAIDLEPAAGAFARAAARIAAGVSRPSDEAIQLVGMMTVAERLDCLDGDLDAWPGLFDMMGGGYHRHTFPAAAVERLGVPGLRFSDGPRGCVINTKTAFPVTMARGASWDRDLEERIGVAIGTELRSEGADFYGGVCINLLRHPAWGRAQETYGEEPYHVGTMGAALTTGAQQRVMACVKHFAVNSMENARFSVDITADERALHEVYLPHFRRVVDAGVASVMSAYNSLNGSFCGENAELLTAILRDEWGFDGFVISDFIFGLRDAAASVRAGLDVEMPFRQQRRMHLADALSEGTLNLTEVERPVQRTVATLLRFHELLTDPANPTSYDAAAHRALARQAAERSIVLLRNEGNVLPLDRPSLRRVAVIGRLAAAPNLGDRGSSHVLTTDVVAPLDGLRAALGDAMVVHHDHDLSVADGADVVVVVVGTTYRDEGEYIGNGMSDLMANHFPPMTDADRAAIAAATPPPKPGAESTTDTGSGSASSGSGVSNGSAPAEVPATGAAPPEEASFGTGGDRRSIRLSADDEALLTSAGALGVPVIAVMMGGSAFVVEPWRDAADAIVMLWYPGVEGGHALADVLLGTVNPSGRLPFSIPVDEAHLPGFDADATTFTYDMWHGHWKLRRDGHPAAYPFGFGLSYTSFEITDATVAPSSRGATIRASVANTGNRDGDVVLQVYAGLDGSAVERPPRRLVGFTRASVAAGASIVSEIEVDLGELLVRREGAWWMEPGFYSLWVGQHADDPAAHRLSLRVD